MHHLSCVRHLTLILTYLLYIPCNTAQPSDRIRASTVLIPQRFAEKTQRDETHKDVIHIHRLMTGCVTTQNAVQLGVSKSNGITIKNSGSVVMTRSPCEAAPPASASASALTQLLLATACCRLRTMTVSLPLGLRVASLRAVLHSARSMCRESKTGRWGIGS